MQIPLPPYMYAVRQTDSASLLYGSWLCVASGLIGNDSVWYRVRANAQLDAPQSSGWLSFSGVPLASIVK